MKTDKEQQFAEDLADLEKTIAEGKQILEDSKKSDPPTIKEALHLLAFIIPIFLITGYFLHRLFPNMDSDSLSGATEIAVYGGLLLLLLLYAWLYPKYIRRRANMRLQWTGGPKRAFSPRDKKDVNISH